MANRIFTQIKALVSIKDNPDFNSYDPIKKVLWVAHELSGAMTEVYDGLRGGPAMKAELSEALQLFHAEYFVPIDLPVNDMMEAFIEGQLAALYPVVVESIDAALDKKLPDRPAPDQPV